MPGSDYNRELNVAMPKTVQIMSEGEKKGPHWDQGGFRGGVGWVDKMGLEIMKGGPFR